MSLSQWIQKAAIFRAFGSIIYTLNFVKEETIILNFSHRWCFLDLQLFLLFSLGFFLWVFIRTVLSSRHITPAEVWPTLSLKYHTSAYTSHQRSFAFSLMGAECCLTSPSSACVWPHVWIFFYVHLFLLNSYLVLKKKYLRPFISCRFDKCIVYSISQFIN